MPKGHLTNEENRARGPRCALYRHGMAKTPEHNAWCLMKARCHNKNHPRYSEWGGKGVTVCDEWRGDFMAFYRYIGPRPTPQHSVDRIDGALGYQPGNVRWATKSEQSSNRPSFVWRIEHDGRVQTLTQLARELGISRCVLKLRLDKGWNIQGAQRPPPKKRLQGR
jgi:hypothetical protein